MSKMIFTESTRRWGMRMEMINQLNEVVDGLNECTKSANTIEEINAILESELKR
jgi:hypothetical protein